MSGQSQELRVILLRSGSSYISIFGNLNLTCSQTLSIFALVGMLGLF